MPNLYEVTPSPFTKRQMRRYADLFPALSCKLETEARALKRFSVTHVNSAHLGGGVAELLRGQVPFERALGIDSRWLVTRAPRQFFRATRQLHNLLQGQNGFLREKDRDIYLKVNEIMAASLSEFLGKRRAGILILHDPQPLPLVSRAGGWIPISRLHVDLSSPNAAAVNFIKPLLEQCRAIVISNPAYADAFPWLGKKECAVIYPAIDPFSKKNIPIDPEAARSILDQFGINPTKPVASQISRFDFWKDPLSVIRAYYFAKNKIPDLQLILAGFMDAEDDPEAAEVLAKVEKHARGDRDIFLFSRHSQLGNVSVDLFINAVYTRSAVMLQGSVREGFGLTMTEAMWKGKALIARRSTGASIQISDGRTGFLVSSAEEMGKRLIFLLKNEKRRKQIGAAARRSVMKKFTLPRFVMNNLKLYRRLIGID